MYSKQLVLLLVIVASATACAKKTDDIGEQEKGQLNFCQQCRSIVSFVSRFNASNARQDYKKIFEAFCEQYYGPNTDSNQGPCPVLVEGVFYWIEKIDPINHCDQIGACGLAPAKLDLFPSKQIRPSFSSNSIQAAGLGGDGGVVCSVCEQVIQQIQAVLDPEFERKMHLQIDAFCDYLKVVKQDKQCEQVLNKNLDDIISFFRNLNPHNYCQSLQLCNDKGAIRKLGSRPVPTLADFQDFGIEVSVEKGGQVTKDLESNNFNKGPNCLLCKVVIKELFKFLKDKRTEVDIRDGLDKICGMVYRTGPKFDQCEHLVATYTKEIIELVSEETNPELVCMLLEQCTHQIEESKTKSLVQRNQTATSGVDSISMSQFISMLDSTIPVGSLRTCVECKLFVKYIQDSFEDEKTQEKLKQWLLDNLCSTIEEKQMKNSCVELVNTYEEAFFKAVAQEMDPQVVCLDLKACQPRRITHKRIDPPIVRQLQPSAAKPAQTRTKTQMCDTCIDIISKLDEYLSEHSVDDDVSVLIDKVCNKMENAMVRQECTVLVKTLGQDIAQAISTMDDPRQLCSKLQVC